MNGAEVIARSIKRQGLKRVFTFPGGTIAPVFDALVKEGIEIVCARHEQGAGYMALAIARLLRKPEVVLVTSGPGATNLITVVADAYYDSTPLIAITGQVGTGDLFSGRKVRQLGFQQVDTIALMKPVTKAALLPKSPDELPGILEDAFNMSRGGRPGPVVIDLPMDVQRGALEKPFNVELRRPSPIPEARPGDITQATHLITDAKRPVILAGQGVILSDAVAELRELAEYMSIPVVMSLPAVGIMPSRSPLSLGFIGHTGNQYGGLAVQNADLLIAIGTRLDVRQTGTRMDKFVPGGKVIRIDLDASELEYPRVRAQLNIHSDAKQALRGIIAESRKNGKRNISGWLSRINEWMGEFQLSFDRKAKPLKPQLIIETVSRLSSGRNVVVTSGVGSHQQWAARHFDFDYPSRAWLTSAGHGAMGYDLPSAIGAQMARPDDLVVCFVGDGSLQINIQELQTAAQYNTPVKIFVIDNNRLGIVSQFQLANWGSDPATGGKINPDFAAIARAYGVKAFTLEDPPDAESVIREALGHKGPALVHCRVDPGEDVVPMLLAGQTMDRMWPHDSR